MDEQARVTNHLLRTPINVGDFGGITHRTRVGGCHWPIVEKLAEGIVVCLQYDPHRRSHNDVFEDIIRSKYKFELDQIIRINNRREIFRNFW